MVCGRGQGNQSVWHPAKFEWKNLFPANEALAASRSSCADGCEALETQWPNKKENLSKTQSGNTFFHAKSAKNAGHLQVVL